MQATVALRKESVDRNYQQAQLVNGVQKSLSARRAWIEISRAASFQQRNHQVALRKESVDRNCSAILASLASMRRSPQGERG